MPPSLLDAEFLTRLGSIVVIDLLLAGDNAVVIALAVRSLPPREQFFGRMFGTGGAVVLRVALIALATVLLTIPFMQLAGGSRWSGSPSSWSGPRPTVRPTDALDDRCIRRSGSSSSRTW